MKKQKRTFKILKSITFFVICITILIYIMPFARNLQDVNDKAYAVARGLISNELVVNKDVKIYVGHTPLMYLYAAAFAEPLLSRIFIRKDLLGDEYFDVLIAHELGHIEVSHSQDKADLFAAKLVGKDRFFDYLAYVENRRKSKNRLVYLFSYGLYTGLYCIITDPFAHSDSEKIKELVNKVHTELK